ncbi:MAG: DUF1697 domain-containing protein [Ilumatobacteraceae bacterium]
MTGTTRYVALIRGINVGGKNVIRMAPLRAEFESHGFERVETYVQSGNVVFESTRPRNELEPAIEQLLDERVGARVPVMIRSHAELAQVVASAPDGFGTQPETLLCDVVFLKGGLPAAPRRWRRSRLRDGVDRA